MWSGRLQLIFWNESAWFERESRWKMTYTSLWHQTPCACFSDFTYYNPLDWLIWQTGSKLPSALPTFLGSIQGEDLGVDEEEQLGSDEQGRSSEELVTCSSQDQAMMQDCYSKIVEKLSLANPSMVLQVEGWPRLHVLYGGGLYCLYLNQLQLKFS